MQRTRKQKVGDALLNAKDGAFFAKFSRRLCESVKEILF